MKHYVLGFIFNQDKTKVLLVHKKRPSWQAGKWNGIGGKIEEKDMDPLEAMQRECIEEIGYEYKWKHCITFVCSGGTVFIYKAISNYASAEFSDSSGSICYEQIEDEELKIWPVNLLPDFDAVLDLKWFIPVCLSTILFPVVLHENDIMKQTEKSGNWQGGIIKNKSGVMKHIEIRTEIPVAALPKKNKSNCRYCKGTGKPCSGCGEYHLGISMCPPHEVRIKWGKNICPGCGLKEKGEK